MGNITQLHPERVRFCLENAEKVRRHVCKGITRVVAEVLIERTNFATGIARLTVNEASRETGVGREGVAAAFQKLCALGVVERPLEANGQVGFVFHWRTERLAELAKEIAHDNGC